MVEKSLCIYNWKLEKRPGPGSRKLEAAQRNVQEENRNKGKGIKVVLRRYANKSRVKGFHAKYHRPCTYAPEVVLKKQKRQRGKKGKRKRKKSCQATRVLEALHLRYGNRVEAAYKPVKAEEA